MDEVEIANLVYQYAEHIDSGNLDAAAELFAHARIKLQDGREPVTHHEILALWRQVMILYPDGTPRTKHLINNPIIQLDRAAGQATCRTYYTVIQGLEDFPLQVIASGRYHDEFERVDGRWRFSFRDYSLLDIPGDLSRHVRETGTPRGFGVRPWTAPASGRGSPRS